MKLSLSTVVAIAALPFLSYGIEGATEEFSDLPADVKDDFAEKMQLTAGFEALPMQDASVTVTHRTCNGVTNSFDLLGMELSPTLYSGTVCTLEGAVIPCQSKRVEFKRLSDGTKVRFYASSLF